MARIFILGAGFSRPAGLPLGSELFKVVWQLAKIRGDTEGKLGLELQRYRRFIFKTTGRRLSIERVNFEDFMSFLDVEHVLKLKGKDHWSDEGNMPQLVLRKLLALALYRAQEAATTAQLSIYDKFVRKLKKYDWIVTFNYDTILEQALERNGAPFRLVPERYLTLPDGSIAISDAEDNDIRLIKLHGSIDWFDRMPFEQMPRARDPIFGQNNSFLLSPISQGPYPMDSPLRTIYRLANLGEYFYTDSILTAPVIVAPSSHKLAYIHRFSELWRELSNAGFYAASVGIIGFSLSSHDAYLKQVIFEIVDTFQSEEGERYGDRTKLKMIDYRFRPKQVSEYRSTFSFVKWEDTDLHLGGFDEAALDILFTI